jgi:hypothetical protein
MDKIVLAGQIFWMTFGVATVIACLLSSRSRRAMLIARAMVGMVMIVGAALLNTVYLLAGNDYAVFMDASWFPWVTETWRAVVPSNHVLLIGLLILFEAAVGVLILIGGRMTQLGLACAIAFHLAVRPVACDAAGRSRPQANGRGDYRSLIRREGSSSPKRSVIPISPKMTKPRPAD